MAPWVRWMAGLGLFTLLGGGGGTVFGQVLTGTRRYPSSTAEADWEAGRYLPALLEFRNNRITLTKPEDPLRFAYWQDYATRSAAVGNIRDAFDAFEQSTGARPPQADAADSLNDCQPVDAVREIVKLAERRQAVFVNEAHHVPQHRVLTYQLLLELRKLGYRYFAAEALIEGGRQIRERGFAAVPDSGFYLAEPLYAELVRTALALDYRVISYEFLEAARPEAEAGNFQRQRDRGQARNLHERIFRLDPGAKVLVHAGYDHIQEKERPEWSPMALHFRELTGIDPLTVDQVGMTEASNPQLEVPLYREAMERWKPKRAMVCREADGSNLRYRVNGSARGFVDMQVIQPRSRVEEGGGRGNGRPEWMRLGGARRPVRVDLAGLRVEPQRFPLLVQAMPVTPGSRDGAKSPPAPLDQIEVHGPATAEAVLLVPTGEYVVAVQDRAGSELARLPARRMR